MALACGGGGSEAPDSSRLGVGGWEFLVQPREPRSSLPPSPEQIPSDRGEWAPLEEMSRRPPSGHELWMRTSLPPLEESSVLFLRAYESTFSLYLDGEPIYEYGMDSFPAGGAGRLRYHPVPIPAARSERSLLLWVPRPGPGLLRSGSWELVPWSSFPGAFSDYVKSPLQEDLGLLLLASLFIGCGLLATAVSLMRWRSGELLLFTFGIFVSLYGARLLVSTHLVVLLDLPIRSSLYINAFITYLITIPAWLFFRQLLGPGWKLSLTITVAVFGAFAATGVATDLWLGAPGTLSGWPNNLLVLSGLAVVVTNVLHSPPELTREIRFLGVGLGAFGLGALHDNLGGLVALPWSAQLEWLGFLLFIASLGYVAVRRFSSRERRLVTLESELETARRIQGSILPDHPPRMDGLSLACRYVPMSAVAGDFYDFLVVDRRRLGVLISDVSGHGVPAALIASMVKVALTAQVSHVDRPARLLGELNRILCGNLRREFVTACYLFLDREKSTVLVGSAGHPRPLLWRAGARGATELEAKGPLLGRFPGATYDSTSYELREGDRLVLYTDGVVETRNRAGEQFGEGRLARFLAEHAEQDNETLSSTLVYHLLDWSSRREEGFEDDLTLVVIDVERLD